MTQPTSRATLKDYAKRQLGHPVVELNLDDDQMEDRIDDALEYFQEYHFDATEPTFLKHQITGSTLKLTANVVFTAGETITGGTTGVRATVHDYISANTTIRYKNPEVKSGGDGNTFYANTTTTFGNGETVTGATSGASATTAASNANSLGDFDNEYISITENIIGVKGVIPFYRETEGNTNMFSVNYQYALNDLYRMGTGAQMSNYVFTQQQLTTINNLFNTMPRFRFNRHTDRLYLDVRWGDDVKIDDFIVAECYTITDPSSFSDVYGDMFLKKYVTSLFKKQWGQNLIKFEGLQLPGGVTLNGRQLYDDATQEIERIEEEVQLKYQLPDDFMIG
tara:strand:- start:1356 stop:2366 length:1011 start_codon:yes stop_codon:yes gene_type:complete